MFRCVNNADEIYEMMVNIINRDYAVCIESIVKQIPIFKVKVTKNEFEKIYENASIEEIFKEALQDIQ
ncbi:MAG: hypothetical protein MJB14_14755 [Spirochaetes bacterium]|nr:hypothetical protein [Spirochaetota bacterium]